MNSTFRILSFIILLLPCFTAFSFSRPDSIYTRVTKFDPTRDANKDLNNAIKEANKSERRIILDVGGEWCIWCHRLDKFIESNDDIKTYLEKNFIVLKINYSKENRNKEFLSHYPEIPGYPHFFILEKNGDLIHSQNTGELEQDKSYSREKMKAFLKRWTP